MFCHSAHRPKFIIQRNGTYPRNFVTHGEIPNKTTEAEEDTKGNSVECLGSPLGKSSLEIRAFRAEDTAFETNLGEWRGNREC